MISSSITPHIKVGDSGKLHYITSVQGCSEFPAFYANTIAYSSLALFLFHKNNNFSALIKKIFGEEFTMIQYMQDYIDFVMKILDELNKAGDEIYFEKYTLNDLIIHNGIETVDSSLSFKFDEDGGMTKITTPGDYINDISGISINDTIGIKTNCNTIRRESNTSHYQNVIFNPQTAKYSVSRKVDKSEKNRKVQIAHPMIRIMYSEQYPVAMMALLIHKKLPLLEPLHCLWMAYKLKYAVRGQMDDYGDIFHRDAEFITTKDFVSNFFCNDAAYTNGVMIHFMPKEESPLKAAGITEFNVSDANVFNRVIGAEDFKAIDNCPKSWFNIVDKFTDQSFLEIEKIVNEAIEFYNDKLNRCEFIFNEKLFSSVVKGESYDGIHKPNSKLGRIIFKDEEGSYLSVLKTSKFIKIKE